MSQNVSQNVQRWRIVIVPYKDTGRWRWFRDRRWRWAREWRCGRTWALDR